MFTMGRVVIACMGFFIFSASANGQVTGYLYAWDLSPNWSFQYDDVIHVSSDNYCEVHAPASGTRWFYAVAVIRNDENLIVAIDTVEFSLEPETWDIRGAIASEVAEPPNISYKGEVEVWTRPDQQSQWSLLDSDSDTTYTD